MNSLEVNTNCTTRFLLPIVFPNTTYDELIANGFKKAYVGMLDDDAYDDSLILVFHKDTDEDMLEELFDGKDVTIVEDEHDDELQLIIVENWSEESIDNEYSNFLTGKWSKFSVKSKDNIQSFWNDDAESILNMILYKNPKFQDNLESFLSTIFVGKDIDNPDAEFWPQPDIIEDELYFSGDLR